MVEFGDEFIFETSKVPWLIWIQLLVTFLLIILLLFGFTLFSSDSAAAPSSTAPDTTNRGNPPTASDSVAKVDGYRVRTDAGTSEGSIQHGPEREEGSSTLTRTFEHPFHPCNYFGLAKQALFKCFGLDSTSENSSNHHHEKQE